MILAAGLTPAWQQILVFDSFAVGEVNRATEIAWCASGKVLNVGIALGQLGGASKTVALVGGSSGEAIRREFEKRGAEARWVAALKSTRICTTILDSCRQSTTELVENSAEATADELDQFLAAFSEEAARADIVVVSGSLPRGTPVTFYRKMLERSQGRVILDARGPEMLEALSCRPFLVKPNREELESTLSRQLNTDDQLVTAMREINRRGAEWVVITQGSGNVWATTQEQVYRFTPPTVRVVNPIGCGDCMAAGLAWAIENDFEMPDALRVGMAAAADNLGQLLSARIDLERVRGISQTIDEAISFQFSAVSNQLFRLNAGC